MACTCGDRDSHFLSASSVDATSSAKVCGGLVSARYSRWCGGAVLHVDRVSSVRSLTVLVNAQKKAADSTYPMGIKR